MKHITGSGGEQFGFHDMIPNTYYSWRFFYTSNVSVKKKLVDDWNLDGFSDDFRFAAYEDGEFAYRLGKKLKQLNIFYTDRSLGYHYHRHDVRSFLRRQRQCGAMAVTFFNIHPEVISKIGLVNTYTALMSHNNSDLDSIRSNLGLAQDLFLWAEQLEACGDLGKEDWHKQLLHSIFELSYLLGFIDTMINPTHNYGHALSIAIDQSTSRLSSLIPRYLWGKS